MDSGMWMRVKSVSGVLEDLNVSVSIFNVNLAVHTRSLGVEKKPEETGTIASFIHSLE